MRDLLVVAGEASGDRAAAGVARALGSLGADVRPFGLGGASLEAEGAELTRDLRGSTALGVSEVAARAYAIGSTFASIEHAAKTRKPKAALLVNYSDFNARLAPRLRARGVRVLWYGAPQIWAWRPNRAETLRRSIDRMALMLPFEEPLWRQRGVDAHYVGHPAAEQCEGRALDRLGARESMGLTPLSRAVAILPGSRPHEVDRLLAPMLDAYERVRHDRASVDGRVLLAPSLDPATRDRAYAYAKKRDVEVVAVDARVGASPYLAAFDVALCASGTAALEATLARAVPVVVYRVGLATELVARVLVKTEYVALPNVILARSAFPELLQRDVNVGKIAVTLARALDAREAMLGACDEVERALGPRRSPSLEVARMLAPWIA